MEDQDQVDKEASINIELMRQSVDSECKDLGENIGISVALWRLRELIQGYTWAVSKGYIHDQAK